jgi:hypothetical protein
MVHCGMRFKDEAARATSIIQQLPKGLATQTCIQQQQAQRLCLLLGQQANVRTCAPLRQVGGIGRNVGTRCNWPGYGLVQHHNSALHPEKRHTQEVTNLPQGQPGWHPRGLSWVMKIEPCASFSQGNTCRSSNNGCNREGTTCDAHTQETPRF